MSAARGKPFGRIEDEAMLRVNRAPAVWIGLAQGPRLFEDSRLRSGENARRFPVGSETMPARRETMVTSPELVEFRRQCERQLARTLSDRIRFGFFRNPDPVRDSGRNFAFASMADYRRFCEDRYPRYFGYWRPPQTTPPA